MKKQKNLEEKIIEIFDKYSNSGLIIEKDVEYNGLTLVQHFLRLFKEQKKENYKLLVNQFKDDDFIEYLCFPNDFFIENKNDAAEQSELNCH